MRAQAVEILEAGERVAAVYHVEGLALEVEGGGFGGEAAGGWCVRVRNRAESLSARDGGVERWDLGGWEAGRKGRGLLLGRIRAKRSADVRPRDSRLGRPGPGITSTTASATSERWRAAAWLKERAMQSNDAARTETRGTIVIDVRKMARLERDDLNVESDVRT